MKTCREPKREWISTEKYQNVHRFLNIKETNITVNTNLYDEDTYCEETQSNTYDDNLSEESAT